MREFHGEDPFADVLLKKYGRAMLLRNCPYTFKAKTPRGHYMQTVFSIIYECCNSFVTMQTTNDFLWLRGFNPSADMVLELHFSSKMFEQYVCLIPTTHEFMPTRDPKRKVSSCEIVLTRNDPTTMHMHTRFMTKEETFSLMSASTLKCRLMNVQETPIVCNEFGETIGDHFPIIWKFSVNAGVRVIQSFKQEVRIRSTGDMLSFDSSLSRFGATSVLFNNPQASGLQCQKNEHDGPLSIQVNGRSLSKALDLPFLLYSNLFLHLSPTKVMVTTDLSDCPELKFVIKTI